MKAMALRISPTARSRRFRYLPGLVLGGLIAAAPAIAEDLDCKGSPSQTKLVIVVEQVKSASGTVRITMYPDDAARFLKHGGPIHGLSGLPFAATAPVTQACVWLPGPGGYAVSIYHDANGNGHFDQNFLGLPLEGFGFSNNPSTALGAPNFADARFAVTGGELTIHIKLRYL
jgi:uncharacterized protein (DUF2141 family)